MNNLKCPFCQQECVIHKDDSCFGKQRCVCRNPNCEFDGWHFPARLLSELIRTRKALAVAVDALNIVTATPLNSRVIHDVANTALDKITALEQKDK